MGMLEARIRILTNNSDAPTLSPQQVVSCSEYSQGKLTVNLCVRYLTDSSIKNKTVIGYCTFKLQVEN